MKAKLSDIVDALETGSDDFRTYLQKDSGKVVMIGEEYFGYAERPDPDDDWPDWMIDIVDAARDINEHPENYLELPSSWDIHEYKVMEAFCQEQENLSVREKLLRTIRGRGAFRRFKDRADDLGVIDDWYAYKIQALTEIAVDWCKENSVEHTD